MTAEPQRTTVEDDPQRRRYEIFVDDKLAGFLRYRTENDRLVLEHTEIDPPFGGQGLGRTLVGAALDQLEQLGRRIRVECEFVQGCIDRNPRYSSLVG